MASPPAQQKRVVIVGGGIGGLQAAVGLKNELGVENFTIYEKNSDVGGTWHVNTYPGCSSDIAGHWYSLSTEPNPDWSSYYVRQPEIIAYWKRVHEKHNLGRHTVYNTIVYSARWNEETQTYTLVLQDATTGEEKGTTETDILIYAVGELHLPNFPELPGLDSFKGDSWHSANWRHDVSLAGKRVAVLGNGCSACQFIPVISEDPSVKITNFYRTPSWFLPFENYQYPAAVKWIFKHAPFVMRGYRTSVIWKTDLLWLCFTEGGIMSKLVGLLSKQHIKSNVPKKYQQQLIPKYSPGCKRVVMDSGYLKSLSRPNVDLINEPIQQILENGIKLQNGEIHEFDVIICATGFTNYSKDLMRLEGRNGKTMQEYSDERGGPTMYKGGWVPGFPNCTIILGANVVGGHSAVPQLEEIQIALACQLIAPVLRGEYSTFEPTEEANVKYNTWLQKKIATTVWTGCQSWYQNEKSGKNVMLFPGTIMLFWWLLRTVVKEDWIFK